MSAPAWWLGHKRARRIDLHDAIDELRRLRKELDEAKRELRELKSKEDGQWLSPPPVNY